MSALPSPIALVGCGRAGGALAAALAEAGATLRLVSRRPRSAAALARKLGDRASAMRLDEALAGAALVIVARRDAELDEADAALDAAWPAETSREPRVALHLAGAHPAAALVRLAGREVAVGVLHPVVALEGPKSAARLEGARATVSGDATATRAARQLARALGLVPLAVDDERRPLVHLACVMAAGDLVTLAGLAEELLVGAGAGPREARALIVALSMSAISGFAERGPLEGLTGPLARGDAATLAAHRRAAREGRRGEAALASLGEAWPIHRELAAAALTRLVRAGRLDEDAAGEVARALGLRGPGRAGT